MARLRDSTLAAVTDPTDATVRARVAWLFHDKSMVTDELVNLRRTVYTRPGFDRAIRDTLVLQDPVTRARFSWHPSRVGRVAETTLVLSTDHDPTGGLIDGKNLLNCRLDTD